MYRKVGYRAGLETGKAKVADGDAVGEFPGVPLVAGVELGDGDGVTVGDGVGVGGGGMMFSQ